MNQSPVDPLVKLQTFFSLKGVKTFRDGCQLVTENKSSGAYYEVRASLLIDAIFEAAVEDYGYSFYDLPPYARAWAAASGLRAYLRSYRDVATKESTARAIEILNKQLTNRGLLQMMTDDVLAGE